MKTSLSLTGNPYSGLRESNANSANNTCLQITPQLYPNYIIPGWLKVEANRALL